MNNRLSQDEIDALLNGTSSQSEDTEQPQEANLSELERDAIGEIGNISFGARLRRCPLFKSKSGHYDAECDRHFKKQNQ